MPRRLLCPGLYGSSVRQRDINCNGVVFMMCDVLTPSLSSTRKVHQMKKTLDSIIAVSR